MIVTALLWRSVIALLLLLVIASRRRTLLLLLLVVAHVGIRLVVIIVAVWLLLLLLLLAVKWLSGLLVGGLWVLRAAVVGRGLIVRFRHCVQKFGGD